MLRVKKSSLRWYLTCGDEGVVLRAVVGVVEGRRHRVLVRGVGLAVRVGRHEREVLGDAGAEAAVAGALRIAEEHTLAGRELRAVRPARDQHPHHRLAVLSELHVRVQLGHVARGGHVDHERRRLRRREIVGADQSPVGTRAECEPRHGVGLEHRAQRLRGDDRSRHPAPGHGCRLVRVRRRRRRAQHDPRVPPDDHGRPAGATVKRVDRELHRPGPRYECRAAVCRSDGSADTRTRASARPRASHRRRRAGSRRRRRPRRGRRARTTSWARRRVP